MEAFYIILLVLIVLLACILAAWLNRTRYTWFGLDRFNFAKYGGVDEDDGWGGIPPNEEHTPTQEELMQQRQIIGDTLIAVSTGNTYTLRAEENNNSVGRLDRTKITDLEDAIARHGVPPSSENTTVQRLDSGRIGKISQALGMDNASTQPAPSKAKRAVSNVMKAKQDALQQAIDNDRNGKSDGLGASFEAGPADNNEAGPANVENTGSADSADNARIFKAAVAYETGGLIAKIGVFVDKRRDDYIPRPELCAYLIGLLQEDPTSAREVVLQQISEANTMEDIEAAIEAYAHIRNEYLSSGGSALTKEWLEAVEATEPAFIDASDRGFELSDKIDTFTSCVRTLPFIDELLAKLRTIPAGNIYHEPAVRAAERLADVRALMTRGSDAAEYAALAERVYGQPPVSKDLHELNAEHIAATRVERSLTNSGIARLEQSALVVGQYLRATTDRITALQLRIAVQGRDVEDLRSALSITLVPLVANPVRKFVLAVRYMLVSNESVTATLANTGLVRDVETLRAIKQRSETRTKVDKMVRLSINSSLHELIGSIEDIAATTAGELAAAFKASHKDFLKFHKIMVDMSREGGRGVLGRLRGDQLTSPLIDQLVLLGASMANANYYPSVADGGVILRALAMLRIYGKHKTPLEELAEAYNIQSNYSKVAIKVDSLMHAIQTCLINIDAVALNRATRLLAQVEASGNSQQASHEFECLSRYVQSAGAAGYLVGEDIPNNLEAIARHISAPAPVAPAAVLAPPAVIPAVIPAPPVVPPPAVIPAPLDMEDVGVVKHRPAYGGVKAVSVYVNDAKKGIVSNGAKILLLANSGGELDVKQKALDLVKNGTVVGDCYLVEGRPGADMQTLDAAARKVLHFGAPTNSTKHIQSKGWLWKLSEYGTVLVSNLDTVGIF